MEYLLLMAAITLGFCLGVMIEKHAEKVRFHRQCRAIANWYYEHQKYNQYMG